LFDFDGARERDILLRRNRRQREQKRSKEQAAEEHVKTILPGQPSAPAGEDKAFAHTRGVSFAHLDKLKACPTLRCAQAVSGQLPAFSF
jgi:hypothetical protein